MSPIYKLYNGRQLRTRCSVLWLVLAAPLLAQTDAPAPAEMPVGFQRGAFAGWQGTASAGDFSVQADGSLLLCHYDAHSYMERDHRRIAIAAVQPGELLEVLADRKPGSRNCYARIVQVVNSAAPQARLKARPASNVLGFTPKGDRTISGIIISVDPQSLSLRTREGEITLRLRPDTRYLRDGLRTDSAALAVNARVFVRAGKDIYGVLEAYQVMWGEILPGR